MTRAVTARDAARDELDRLMAEFVKLGGTIERPTHPSTKTGATFRECQSIPRKKE